MKFLIISVVPLLHFVAHLAYESLRVICSMDSKCREESARLLGCLIRSCARLILPYIAPVHKVSKIDQYLCLFCKFYLLHLFFCFILGTSG